ncbi:MAG TPA: site-specific integrase, partial [Candidatus Woesebacteria bacterium]|nr:site-specific integrase [Candidatus Woesebacteria bacterium]
MPAQQRYITSILSTFSSFLESWEQGQSSNSSLQELKIAGQELLVEFLAWKEDFNTWSEQELNQFVEQAPDLDPGLKQALPLLIQFVNDYPPFQTNVFLQEFLLALKKEECSNSTIKNYRSDIGQFLEFCHETELEKILTKTKLNDFYRFQAQKGLKGSSITRKFSSIVQFGLWLKTEGALPQPPEWLKVGFIFEPETAVAKTTPTPSPKHVEQFVQNQISDKKAQLLTSNKPDSRTSPTVSRLVKAPLFSADNRPATARANQEKRARAKLSLNKLTSKIQHKVGETFDQVTQRANLNILPYINLTLILLFFLGLGTLGYSQLITNAPFNFAYSTTPTPPGRTLSFQGRLTDPGQNPIIDETPMTFRLFNVKTGGSALWTSSGCTVDPDQDGIFAVGLGDLSECGPAIDPSVFSENPNIWLEVQVDTETLTPRQAIRTVAYA